MSNYNELPPDIPVSVMEDEAKRTGNGNSRKNDLSKYLDVLLDKSKNETKKELKIRLLPLDLKTGNPFQRVFMHTLRVDKNVFKKEWINLVCLQHNDEFVDKDEYGHECPICRLNSQMKKDIEATNRQNAVLAKSISEDTAEITRLSAVNPNDPKIVEISNRISAKRGEIIINEGKIKQFEEIKKTTSVKEAYIVRCIDRAHEDEGPKFWRFKTRRDGTDPHAAILSLMNKRLAEADEARRQGVPNVGSGNILSLYDGKDLNITVNEGNAAPIITDSSYNTPITNDPEKLKKWYYEDTDWREFFKIRTAEYMELVYEGKYPRYDRMSGKWVSQDEFDKMIKSKKSESDGAIANAEAVFQGPVEFRNVQAPQMPQFQQPVFQNEAYNPSYQSEVSATWAGPQPQQTVLGSTQTPQGPMPTTVDPSTYAAPKKDIISEFEMDDNNLPF